MRIVPLSSFRLAFQAFRRILSDSDFAKRVAAVFEPVVEGPDLRMLALLQRDGRLVDFLQEDIEDYNDAQVGAAVRDIHRGCRKVLAEYLKIEPVLQGTEDDPVSIAADFDPAAVRLIGNVQGTPPFRGVLKHHGWRATAVNLPALAGEVEKTSVIAPAEVEIP